MKSIETLLAAAALFCVAAVASAEGATAKELGETYQRTRADADRAAWYAALAEEKWDFSKRVRDKEDARGVYKLNRDSTLACIVLRKTEKAGDSWDEDLGPDGKLHLEWTRRANGAIDYKYSAPTNWDVFVSAYPGAVTRWGVKVMKVRTGADDPMPEVKLPEGWRVVPGEAYSGVNVREAYLTFEKDGLKLPPPAVELSWPGPGVRAVHGASNVVVTAASATFVPSARKPPTSFQTGLPREGAISCSVTHHLRGMQAGPHRSVPYPENEIRAMRNFIFALRAGFRHLGFGEKDAMDGSVVLCGFDSNFPNGHTDFPAHFHIINGCRDGTQVNHFYMDPETGRVTWNCYQDMSNVMDVWDVVRRYYPGDVLPMYDAKGAVAYRVTMLKDGAGLEVARPDGGRAFRACGTRPCDAVEVWLRDAADAAWRKTAAVSVKDDPVAGVLETPDGVVRYDPDTGARK